MIDCWWQQQSSLATVVDCFHGQVMRNTKRAALVWLDEHLEDYYKKASTDHLVSPLCYPELHVCYMARCNHNISSYNLIYIYNLHACDCTIVNWPFSKFWTENLPHPLAAVMVRCLMLVRLRWFGTPKCFHSDETVLSMRSIEKRQTKTVHHFRLKAG